MPDNRDHVVLASKIIASYLRRNAVLADQLPSVIAEVYQVLTGLAKQAEPLNPS